MSNNAPKVQVESSNAFGQATVRQISLDTNRVDIHNESLFRFGNAVAIPSRGLYTDALLWLLAVATPIRLIDSAFQVGLISAPVGWVLLAILVMPLGWALFSVFVQLPKLRPAVLYRLALVALGLLATFVTFGG